MLTWNFESVEYSCFIFIVFDALLGIIVFGKNNFISELGLIWDLFDKYFFCNNS